MGRRCCSALEKLFAWMVGNTCLRNIQRKGKTKQSLTVFNCDLSQILESEKFRRIIRGLVPFSEESQYFGG